MRIMRKPILYQSPLARTGKECAVRSMPPPT